MKMKILFLAPHLSTGGMPSFLLKQIQLLKDEFDIYVVEYQFFTADFVVQRDAIKDLVGDKLYTLGEDKLELTNIVKNINPDIVHIHDPSEKFNNNMMSELYSSSRTYRIVETCHDVWFRPTESSFQPDAYAFCTPYHLEIFENMPSYKQVLEFPIDDSTNQSAKWISNDFNISETNVINVGLWTPGKNQAEGIEIARKYPHIKFHFIGNQAGNFQNYWEPLMKNLPSNVKVWGERNDVSSFMMLADVFMFNSTIECNPLVLREAIGYNLPIIANNLSYYGSMFDEYIQPIDTDLDSIKVNYKIPTDNTSKIFAEKYTNFYKKVATLPHQEQSISIVQHFVNNPFIEIKSPSKSNFHVRYKTPLGEVVYENKISSNSWAKLNRQYYTKWSVDVYENDKKIYENTLDLTGKRVLICIDSKSLGDNIAWAPYALEFQKKHNCKVILSSFFANILDIPEIEMVEPGTIVSNIYAQYNIGWFYDSNKEPVLPNTIPLQQAATNILGLEYKEIRPRLKFTSSQHIEGDYVTIATNSTAGCKFWTKEGWQGVINYLHEKGYKVINVSLEENPFDNCEQIINHNIEDTMQIITGSKFFIGLGSGVSWLAWALNKPVVMIANFSVQWHEFQCFRVENKSVCNGCWNDPKLKFDKGDWNWCPRHKDTPRQFECHGSISAENVILAIDNVLLTK
jgi:autotransporter strand-loop-strand O-heptosyltransferase